MIARINLIKAASRVGLGLLVGFEPTLLNVAAAMPAATMQQNTSAASRSLPRAVSFEVAPPMSLDKPGDQPPIGSPTLRQAGAGITALSGRILQTDGTPLKGVLLKLGHATALSDANGLFLLVNAPTGTNILRIDGRAAVMPGATAIVDHGIYDTRVVTAAGVTTRLTWTSWLPKIDHAADVALTSPTVKPVVARTSAIPGLELRIPAGAVLTDLDGKTVDHVGLTPIPINRTPFPLPRNVPVPVYFTAQPGGAVISGAKGAWLGAQVVYPNYHHSLPKTRTTFWRYQPDSNGWSPYGSGSVTADERQIVPDPGTRIYALDGAMDAEGRTPPTTAPTSTNKKDSGDPVDLGSGLFVASQTDMTIADVLPLSLTRTYRPDDPNRRMFGVGMSTPWDTFLWSSQEYQIVDLVGADGSRTHFARLLNAARPGDNNFTDAQYTTVTPGPWYGATLSWNGNGWNLVRKDGFLVVFGTDAPLQYVQDRFGNRITLTRTNGQLGNLVQLSSANGRFIRFTYDSDGDVLTATDNIGRKVTYTYDSTDRLQTVTDPNGGVTTYTWDSSNRITAITDARGISFLTNVYDSNNRVTKQTLANGKSYTFAYTLATTPPASSGSCDDCAIVPDPNGSGEIVSTRVTDPNGNVRTVTFNSLGYPVADNGGVSTSVEEDWHYTLDPASNFVTGTTDPLGRQTTFTYDGMGNMVTVTKLAGTANAATTHYTYSPIYNQITSVQDPLGHTTTLTRDPVTETLTSVSDPLGHVTGFTYNSAGQVLTAKDALAHTASFAYGPDRDATALTDPLGRVATLNSDVIGRQVRTTDPLGGVNIWAYDPINGVKTATDPNGHALTTAYTAIGEVASVTDALSHVISYTYDNMGWFQSRTDPVKAVSAVTARDYIGNITVAKDRKAQATTNTYDALNRVTASTYADASTKAWTYDLGDRVTKVADSVGGTITRTYNGLDEVLTETSPQGTVTYTYDLAGRRTSMTAGNQTQVTYTYDNANRLTKIAQGSTAVTFTYDNANRLTQKTMPNSVTAAYAYDNDNEATGITYTTGSTTLGTATYTYDAAGRVASRSGTLFQSVLPAALTSATYNAANRLTQRAGTSTISPTWDANGSLLSDGTNTYTWTARNQLKTIGSTNSFVYDAFGRRETATRASVATSFLYDGWDVAQEQQGGAASANLLTGLNTDERFSRTAAGTTSTYLTDLLGSTLAMASGGTPSVQTSWAYDPHGVSTVSGTANTNTFQYAGRENDGTSLVSMRNRYYNPAWGRFVSEDPIGLAGGSNLYAYANNNPTTFKDPSGLSPGGFVPSFPGPGGGTPPTRPSVLPSCHKQASNHEECVTKCLPLLDDPDLQSTPFRKCYRECMGNLEG